MTAQPHIIQLRHPWQWDERGKTADVLIASRRFNRPTGLDSGTVVDLVVVGLALRSVRLNGQLLHGQVQQDDIWRCEITDRLELRNQLQLELASPVSATHDERLRAQLADGAVRLGIHAPG